MARQTRFIVDAVKEAIAEIRDDVREIKGHRVSDIRWHLAGFAAGFVLLSTMLILGYFRLEDKIGGVSNTVRDVSTSITRIETKLDDLIERIPPIPSPPPRKK